MRNQSLYNQFLKLYLEAMPIIAAAFEKGYLNPKNQHLHTVAETIHTTAEYWPTITKLHKSKAINKHLNCLLGPAGDKTKIDARQTVLYFFIYILELQGDCTINKTAFNDIYSKFEAYFYSNTINYEVVAPLYFLFSDIKQLAISKYLSIINMDENDASKHDYSDENIPSFTSFLLVYRRPHHKFINDNKIGSKYENNPTNTAASLFNFLITAMRLLKSGYIEHGPLTTRASIWVPFLRTKTKAVGERHYRFPDLSNLYLLESHNKDNIIAIFKLLSEYNFSKNPSMETALDRFSFIYQRNLPEDRLIDLMIICESLLLKRTEHQELSYRLALRASYLIGDHSNRGLIFDKLKRAYSIRSDIVHGSKVNNKYRVGGKELPTSEIINDTENIIRLLIVHFLKKTNQVKIKRYLDEVDKKIIGRK